MNWNELYKKYGAKHSASFKNKWLLALIIVVSITMVLTIYVYYEQIPTAECGAADRICPINCDYKKDADCSALSGVKTIIPRSTTTTTTATRITTSTKTATTKTTTSATTAVTTTTTTTENAAASDQASSALANELELAIGSIRIADIMNAINS